MAEKLYTPTTLGQAQDPEVSLLLQAVFRELLLISKQLSDFSYLQLNVRHVAPERPRDGMIVYADGTDWDPGDGVGHYGYVNGTWTKLFP